MGETLANHSYVDISQVGSGSDSVQCHTDLVTCCSGDQGSHRGDWYFPDGYILPYLDGGDIVESRTAQRVELHRYRDIEPTGIYRCDIETNAVNGNGMKETVYVGLYTSDGGKIPYKSVQSPPLLTKEKGYIFLVLFLLIMYITHLGVLIYNKINMRPLHNHNDMAIGSTCACISL